MTNKQLESQIKTMKEVIQELLMYINDYEKERYLYYLNNNDDYDKMLEFLVRGDK